jgi:hypothetical protein
MTITYTHAPRPVGGPVSFKLDGSRLTVDTGRKVYEVPLAAVEEVRLTYEPRSFMHKAFRTRLRLQPSSGAVSLPRTVSLSSLNWKSFIEAERLDGEYRAFVETLLSGIARENPQAAFLAGKPRLVWLGSAMLAGATLAALAAVVARAAQAGAPGAALMGAALIGLGLWQVAPMIRRNRPRTFRPDHPPTGLVP